MALQRLRVRTPRKERMWGITNQNFTIAAATAATMVAIDLLAALKTDVGYDLPGVTASAIRLNVLYRMTTAQGTDEDTVALGIGWISDTAFASGGAALPDPSTDHFDWMFHDIRTLKGEGAADLDQSPAVAGFLQIRNDSMRKQRENHSTLALIVRATQLQSASVQVFVGGRVLFLLP